MRNRTAPGVLALEKGGIYYEETDEYDFGDNDDGDGG